MVRRTPDIFLSPRELEMRAREAKRKADRLAGKSRERLLKEAQQDESMATMKRWVGDAENEVPAQ